MTTPTPQPYPREVLQAAKRILAHDYSDGRNDYVADCATVRDAYESASKRIAEYPEEISAGRVLAAHHAWLVAELGRRKANYDPYAGDEEGTFHAYADCLRMVKGEP